MAQLKELLVEVDACLRQFPDFPKNGVLFRDIMPIFKKPALISRLCRAIADHTRHHNLQIDAVVALDARGFLFGPLIAIELGVPFVPIRKHGKLPGPVHRSSYTKEYGQDSVEIQQNVLLPKQRVLIFDDLLATGGTLKSAIELVEMSGAVVAEALVLIELSYLKARNTFPPHVPLHALLSYDE